MTNINNGCIPFTCPSSRALMLMLLTVTAYWDINGMEPSLMLLVTRVRFLLWQVRMWNEKQSFEIKLPSRDQLKNINSNQAHLCSLPHVKGRFFSSPLSPLLLTRWQQSLENMSPFSGISSLCCTVRFSLSVCGVRVCVCMWQVWSLRGKVGRSHVPWLLRPLRRTSATSANTTTSTASMCKSLKIRNLWPAFLQWIHGD